MNELALFAGAGGGILGGKLLGWRTVCAVEYDCYAAAVLCQRQNDGLLPPFPIWDDVRTFDGRPWRGVVDVVSGGFPCQDISAAGKGGGIENGERSGLWVEMARIIGEIRPRFCFVENSPVLTSRGLGRVLGDLAAMGYDAEWVVLGAADVGAPHQRDRIWIVAYRDSLRELQPQGSEREQRGRSSNSGEDAAHSDEIGRRRGAGLFRKSRRAEPENGGCAASDSDSDQHEGGTHAGGGQGEGETSKVVSADAYRQRREKQHPAAVSGGTRQPAGLPPAGRGAEWWAVEPDVGRVADGVAARVDRLRCLGNGQVPHCAAEAWTRLVARFGL